jgi:hypothetical protein
MEVVQSTLTCSKHQKMCSINPCLIVKCILEFVVCRLRNFILTKIQISYINVQKSKDFNPQENRERKIGRPAERKKDRADNNNLGKGREREKKTVIKRKKELDMCKARVTPTCIL